MSMVCPQCNQIFEQQERVCPSCSIQLLFFARIAPAAPSAAAVDDQSSRWQHTGLGRVIVGLILAQGMALGLKHLLTAGLLARGDAVDGAMWGTITGLALLHSLHALGLLIGGALAGAGQHRAVLNGAIVGIFSGIIFLALRPYDERILSESTYFAQPVLHMLFGAIGGWIGQAIWQPTPRLKMPEVKGSPLPAPPLIEMRWLHGPIAWWRVIAGATIMTCGGVWSKIIMDWMIDASHGTLSITTHFQAKLVSGEIAGLTMLAGACLAGATTWNGAKQGLCVGIGGAVLYLGYQWANPEFQLETVVFVGSCMLGLGIIGGWFGGLLFPPLGRAHRARRIIDL